MAPTGVTASSGTIVRLNKLLVSKIGGMSRREADQLIRANRVLVNGAIITTLGVKLDPVMCTIDVIPLDNGLQGQKTTVVLHKPLGIVSCQPDKRLHHKPAIKLLTHENRFGNDGVLCRSYRTPIEPVRLQKMAVAGRLDMNSSGLLLFTQSGKIASDIIGPQSQVEKEYLIRFRRLPSQSAVVSDFHCNSDAKDANSISEWALERIDCLRRGIDCSGERLEAVSVDLLNADQLRIVLQSGKKHHIRRMMEAVGWSVQALKRVRIGNITLGSLPKGRWRYLSPDESVV